MRINRVKNRNQISNKKSIDLSLIKPLLEENFGKKNLLIPVLQKIQEIYGYLPIQAMEMVANSLNLSPSEVFGVATFYSQFSLKPKGKYIIKVCTGTACHVTGSKKLIDFINEKLNTSETENTTSDGLFTVESVS
jgi:NADH-quinone oxidoreductase subunit E